MDNTFSNYLFLSFVGADYSRASVYLYQNLNETPYKIIKLTPAFNYFFIELLSKRKILRAKNLTIVVLSPCSILVPFLKIITGRPIVLDAGWPLTDAELGNVNRHAFNLRYIKSWVIDFLAFHLAKKTILESQSQKAYVSKFYFVSKSKLEVVFTGVNENKYTIEMDDSAPSNYLKILNEDFVLFRGKNNTESGIENIIKIADISSNAYKFVIVSNKMPTNFKEDANVVFISEYLQDLEIALLYQKCFLSLGQISDSKRLDRTIPHKAFESGYFGTPYLTLKRDGIAEFLSGGSEAIFVDTVNIVNIAKIIEEFHSNFVLQKELKINIKKRYSKIASQTKLKRDFFKILDGIN